MPKNHERTVPSRRTREEEAREARVASGDPASPDGDEAQPPESVDEEAAEHYREMTERGARQEGEGRLP